jgi:sensor histidine kinase YesM
VNVKPKKPILHVLAWIVFIVFHFFILPRPEDFHDAPKVINGVLIMPSLIEIGLLFLSLISFYYFNILYLIPHLLAKRQYWQYCAFVILIAVFVLLAISLPLFFTAGSFVLLPFGFYINSLLLFSLIFIASSMSNIVGRWFTSENNKKDIEYQKTLAELSFLKAQINPHFLFNTLNNIYLLAIKKSEQTPEAILKLASMMRYVLSDAKEETVPLEKEIEYIGKYIDLQKMRLTESVKTDYTVSGYCHNLQIAPLILIPYIENAFKFGVSTHGESHIAVSIAIADKKLVLCTSNLIHNKENIIVESNGIGLVNAQRRLDLFYEKKYVLKIDEDNQNYVVYLELQLG